MNSCQRGDCGLEPMAAMSRADVSGNLEGIVVGGNLTSCMSRNSIADFTKIPPSVNRLPREGRNLLCPLYPPRTGDAHNVL